MDRNIIFLCICMHEKIHIDWYRNTCVTLLLLWPNSLQLRLDSEITENSESWKRLLVAAWNTQKHYCNKTFVRHPAADIFSQPPHHLQPPYRPRHPSWPTNLPNSSIRQNLIANTYSGVRSTPAPRKAIRVTLVPEERPPLRSITQNLSSAVWADVIMFVHWAYNSLLCWDKKGSTTVRLVVTVWGPTGKAFIVKW